MRKAVVAFKLSLKAILTLPIQHYLVLADRVLQYRVAVLIYRGQSISLLLIFIVVQTIERILVCHVFVAAMCMRDLTLIVLDLTIQSVVSFASSARAILALDSWLLFDTSIQNSSAIISLLVIGNLASCDSCSVVLNNHLVMFDSQGSLCR